MIYPYAVKFKGRYYDAGQNVPDEEYKESITIPVDNTKTEALVGVDSDVNGAKVEEEKRSYSKTEINRMALNDLRALASEVGLENASQKTGNELKKELIKFFNA